ncbi:hypothetical protein INT44_002474 [Umbelopsis vinacea]|uniref:Uncharacterized protein n=1 Tax=Umbelopsis vinacea TaxID=44442 RepID=A0A8H7Q4J3_9FUNG|nr:hypothetical protein INT44_002474 [Umbelopsis vinacea]
MLGIPSATYPGRLQVIDSVCESSEPRDLFEETVNGVGTRSLGDANFEAETAKPYSFIERRPPDYIGPGIHRDSNKPRLTYLPSHLVGGYRKEIIYAAEDAQLSSWLSSRYEN